MNGRTWFLTIIFILLFACGCQSPPTTARVIEVIDGDTIVVEGGYRVRYIGIDTPEIHPEVETFGIEAWQANRELVEGEIVQLEQDVSEVDKYGRLLRYVYVDNIFVNAELVKQGLAYAKAYPPDTKHQDYLDKLEQEARQAGRGMWAK
jgi:micrococcal nuclease